MAKNIFSIGEFYHIYNRGVDKRKIYSNKEDLERFLDGMVVFNRIEPVRSLRDIIYRDVGTRNKKRDKIVTEND